MTRLSYLALFITAVWVGSSVPAHTIENDISTLDARIDSLERERAALKKQLKIHALEEETAALKKQLGTAETSRSNVIPVSATRATVASPVKKNTQPALFDYATKVPPSYVAEQFEQLPRWSGFYIGANAGMGFGRWSTAGTFSEGGNTGAVANTLNALGAVAGLQAGYLWQAGAVAFGPEGDISVSTVGQKAVATATEICPVCVPQASTFSAQPGGTISWLSTLRMRSGITIKDWLLFASGGLALADVDVTNPFSGAQNSHVTIGYAAGGGVEYATGPNMRLRLEYLYVGLPNAGFSVQPSPSSAGLTSEVSVRPNSHIVRAGVGWVFP